MSFSPKYEVAIIGGGLAGLALSIQLAAQGRRVALFEKETYPFHRVCGEYISMEAWDFLCSIGVPLTHWNLPRISRLQVSAPGGSVLNAMLPLGGFGVSRYKLDAALAAIARKQGVQVFEKALVENLTQTPEGTSLQVRHPEGVQTHLALVCCGAWGKRSNLDVKWGRPFTTDKGTRISNWVGIKYHVRLPWPDDLIALHNFKDGYCGISRIEGGRACLCYLTRAANLRGSSVAALEKGLMARNPVLAPIMRQAERLVSFPLAISQVSFRPKSQVEEGVLLLGDAAGMITPLCGNGMSMALHASKLAATEVGAFLEGRQSRQDMEARFTSAWRGQFSARLRTGRLLQGFFGSEQASRLLLATMRWFPGLTRKLIKQTHGAPF